jgi:hypothetical protein
MNELRFAIRSLWKAKAFSLATFLTLALCIGANTALFGFVNTVLLKPLPVPDPGSGRLSSSTATPSRASRGQAAACRTTSTASSA